MSTNYYALGQRIRTIRRKRGLTQQKLAEQIPCSATYMSYVENGNNRMSLDMFICVANELKVSADVLLFDSLENTVSVSNHEFAAVLSDCSEYETRILLDIVRSAKKSMRENKRLIRGRHN